MRHRTLINGPACIRVAVIESRLEMLGDTCGSVGRMIVAVPVDIAGLDTWRNAVSIPVSEVEAMEA